jgi:hypothetical protein
MTPLSSYSANRFSEFHGCRRAKHYTTPEEKKWQRFTFQKAGLQEKKWN